MAPRDRPHIIVSRPPETDPYTSHTTGRDSRRPPAPINRHDHGRALAVATRAAAEEGRDRRTASGQVGAAATSEGVYLTFDSFPGFELRLMTFDPQRSGVQPELVAVSRMVEEDQTIERATVFVPDGKLKYFIDRFEAYATEDTPKGAPKHANFVVRIRAVRLATIEALWTGDPQQFPPVNRAVWWEVWLRHRDGAELARLRALAASQAFRVGERHLVFDDRTIVVVRATAEQLSSALDVLDDLAELRPAKVTAAFFDGAPPSEQVDWVTDLVDRTEQAELDAPSVCILDTGVNRAHPLLAAALDDADCHTCDPSWGSLDHEGHGTQMAGLALYGDLTEPLQSSGVVWLRHRLESVKILPPPPSANEPDLYGAVTADAVHRVEIQAPDRSRAFSMAVTAPDDDVAGTPTSWSASIDALAVGRAFETVDGELQYLDEESVDAHRLFVVSSGNVQSVDPEDDHLDRSDVEPVESPAQAWNALTVGGFTELVDVDASGDDFDGWEPIAPPGELSPFSRTSVAFQRSWPIKPEIVMEGGNAARSPDFDDVDWPESLQLLTTYRAPAERLLTVSNATSAATAQAGRLAATVAAEYPSLWPETIRALIVHSAEWTPAMLRNLSAATGHRDREALVRRYGFGVPSEERALRSAGDALTLVLQSTIRPFDDKRLREMHTHDLPWPVEALEDLGAAHVRLRVTLSYFIEPYPARRGWRQRYRYASHGLRFELKRPDEANDDFRKRLNKRALNEDEGRPAGGDREGWFLGSQARSRGSLHTDLWEGSAVELASRGRVAIFPVTGWWKEQPQRDRSDLGVRYGLVVSIETPVETADLWTPVAAQVEVPTVIET